MSMDYYPQEANTISKNFVKEIAEKEFNELIEYLENHNSNLDELMISFAEGQDDIGVLENEEVNAAVELWERLVGKFNSDTSLKLYTVYADAQDRGDELDGTSFAVFGVYGYTSAGEKYKDKIVRKCWNVFG